MKAQIALLVAGLVAVGLGVGYCQDTNLVHNDASDVPRVSQADAKTWLDHLSSGGTVKYEESKPKSSKKGRTKDLAESRGLGPLDVLQTERLIADLTDLIKSDGEQAIALQAKALESNSVQDFAKVYSTLYSQAKFVACLDLVRRSKYVTLVGDRPKLPAGFDMIHWSGRWHVDGTTVSLFFPIDLAEHEEVAELRALYLSGRNEGAAEFAREFNARPPEQRKQLLEQHKIAKQEFQAIFKARSGAFTPADQARLTELTKSIINGPYSFDESDSTIRSGLR